MKRLLNPVYPPLAPVAVFLAAGILTGRAWPDLPVWLPGAGFIVVLLIITLIVIRFKPVVLICCFLAACWGFASMADIQNPDLPAYHISKFADGSRYEITGTIDSFTRHYPRKNRVILVCESIAVPGESPVSTSGKINLSIYRDNNKGIVFTPGYGHKIRFVSPLNAIRNFSNPGGFDYKLHMQYKGVFGSAYAWTKKLEVLEKEDNSLGTVFFQQIEKARDRFWTLLKSRTVEASGSSKTSKDLATSDNAAAILGALITGKKEILSPEIRDAFARAGASHILAISGLHLSIVAFGAYWIFYFLLNRFHRLTVTGQARKFAGMLTLVPLFLYALFAGFSPSTQRAFIMTLVFMTAILTEKENDSLNTLCLAAIIILILDTTALFSISFQLSFSALLFIILGFGAVPQFRHGEWLRKNRAMTFFSGAILVTFFAGLGTFPLIARYFNMVSHVQILSNLILVPVMGFVCLPLGFLGLVSMSVFPGLARGILDLAIEILIQCIGIIEFITGFDWSWSRIITPTWGEVGLFYVFLAGFYLSVTHRGLSRRSVSHRGLNRRRKTGIWLMAFSLVTGSVSAGISIKNRFFKENLTITVLDVGQGNAAVVRTPSGKVLLIDGGGFSGISGFDVGRYVVGPFLWRNRIKTLDGVILSHPESDHMNGLVFILENFRIKRWIKNRDTNNTPAFARLDHLAEKRKILQWFPTRTPGIFSFDGVKLIVRPRNRNQRHGNRNNNSLICRITYKEFSMLFPGDIERSREKVLVMDEKTKLKSKVLLAPHHGSKGSSTKIFLDKVDPESVIVSCGYKNRYGFPHPNTLKRYGVEGVKVFRTDLHGAVTVTTRGRGYYINTNRGF